MRVPRKLVSRLLGVVVWLSFLMPSDAARADTPPGTRASSRPHVDLILIVDTSESMVGKGKAATNIFGPVKDAAKRLVDWTESGDNIVLISYDEKVRLHPAVAVYGAREQDAVKKNIDELRARGLFTYTAEAVREGVSEAARLHGAQRADAGGPHTKFIVLITDGINEPPPFAGKAGDVSLPDVAKQLGDKPWFVWQVQLGPKVDREVEKVFTEANPRGYATLEAPQATGLLDKLRNQVIAELEKRLRRSTVRLEPQSINFGSLQAGSRATQQVRIFADPPDQSGRVRLRAEVAAVGAGVTISPEEVTIPAEGSVEAQFSIDIGPDLGASQLGGLIAAEITEGQLELARQAVTWSVTVSPRSRALRIEPAVLDFGRIRPGHQAVQMLKLRSSSPDAAGQVRLQPERLPSGVQLSVDPELVTIRPGSEGETRVVVEIGPGAPPAALEGRIVAQVVEGSIDLKNPVLAWSLTVPQSVVQLLSQVGGVLILVCAAMAAVLWRRRPRVHGSLRYWKPGQSAKQTDLGSYNKTRIRIGGTPDCEIQLADAASKCAIIRATKQDGLVLCVIKPGEGTSIKHDGRAVNHLDLYDGDEFTFEGYTLAYKGEVPPRPRMRS